MDEQIKIAVITTATTIGAILLKDVLIYICRERKKFKKEDLDIYKRYSKPLQYSLERLIHRLVEICNNKNYILKYDENSSDFYNYKYISTLYRLFSVLAWLRLAGRELTFYRITSGKKIKKLNKSIFNFKSSLADGMDVEMKRVSNVLASTNYTQQLDEEDLKKIGFKLDNLIINTYGKLYYNETKEDLIINVISLLRTELNFDIIVLDKEEFYKTICVTESWIYRDWQDAIGDLMIVNNDIISYKDFEEMYIKKEKSKWIKRGESVFDKLSIGNLEKYDFRVVQIKNILENSFYLLETLQQIKIGGSVVKKERIEKIKDKIKKLGIDLE